MQYLLDVLFWSISVFRSTDVNFGAQVVDALCNVVSASPAKAATAVVLQVQILFILLFDHFNNLKSSFDPFFDT